MVGGVPVENSLAVNVIEEDGRRVGRQLASAEPNLEAFVAQRTEDWFGMRVLHPEDFGEVIHLNILEGPPVQGLRRVVVLMPSDMARRWQKSQEESFGKKRRCCSEGENRQSQEAETCSALQQYEIRTTPCKTQHDIRYVRCLARPSATNRLCSLSSRKCIPFVCIDWITMGPDVGSRV